MIRSYSQLTKDLHFRAVFSSGKNIYGLSNSPVGEANDELKAEMEAI